MKRIPRPILQALKETGLPWDIEQKKRHRVVRLAGKPVTILPKDGKKEESPQTKRAEKNTIASIKREARFLRGN